MKLWKSGIQSPYGQTLDRVNKIGNDMETTKIFWGLVAALGMVGLAVSMLALALTFNPGALVGVILSGLIVAGSVPFLD
jgi:hypothetical protein